MMAGRSPLERGFPEPEPVRVPVTDFLPIQRQLKNPQEPLPGSYFIGR